jgi:outer membrane lipoprotein-sorting protein
VLGLSPASGGDLKSVLARMDAGAIGFQSVTANVRRSTYTALIRERSEESGIVKFLKARNEVRLLLEVAKPEPRSVAFAGRKAQLYYPKINTVQEIDLGKQKSYIDQFILLGFGTTGRELVKSYKVAYGGEETVAGTKASRIELTPNSPQVREQFSRIELWIADPGGFPVQQKLHEPSGNNLTVTYSEIKVNPNLNPQSVALKLPKDVKREYPQK